MVNHIQGSFVVRRSLSPPLRTERLLGEDYFTTKLQLWQSLQTYEKISMSMQKRFAQFLPLNDFVPETFKLDEKADREALFSVHQGSLVQRPSPSITLVSLQPAMSGSANQVA